jgi:hypothetical protein
MSKTKHFNFDYIDPYQLTSKDVLSDERRFTTADVNLFALFKIFGNGVIVLESTEFPLYVELFTGSNATKKITVTAGRAFVNFKSINYSTPTVIELPTQTGDTDTEKFFLYLKDNDNTPQKETGEFFFSSTKLDTSDSYIGLGSIVADYSAGTATYSDDSDNGREIMNVKKLFLSFVNNHAHTGGLGNPKKIDLEKDVMGLLAPENVSIVDASKITGGQLSEFITPQVDHNKLKNTGNLSHAQIDAAVLSFRDSLNLEVVSSVNQVVVTARVIRTTSEATQFAVDSATYPSGSIATIDTGLSNVFIYVPNVTSDGHVVGFNGSTGSIVFPNIRTNATGPAYLATPIEKLAHIDRDLNAVIINATGSGVPDVNVQKIFTLQDINPSTKMGTAGQSGYFGGFTAGHDSDQVSGSIHLIHMPRGNTGPTGAVIEDYDKYFLTLKDRYNSVGAYGSEGVQIAGLLTSLVDFEASSVFADDFHTHLLYSSSSTGPRIISPFHNGYLDTPGAVDFFTTTGPAGETLSFYYENPTGSRAVMFANGNVIANLGSNDYVVATLGSGSFARSNSKIVLGEYSATQLRVTEFGPTGPNQNVNIKTGATNITQNAISSFASSSDYRVFYIDDDKLYVSTQLSTTQLGTFTNVIDMKVKYDTLFILTNENSVQKLYYAYEAGLPTTFSQITLSTTAPASARLDIFKQSDNGPIFICAVSNSEYQVFDITGREIYKYGQGLSGETGPKLKSIYTQFDLGDATVDLKYG